MGVRLLIGEADGTTRAAALLARCEPEGECLVWMGARTPRGYGEVRIAGKLHYVHRLVEAFVRGSLEPGIKVLHRCDNPPCANPEHLFRGTQADNLQDASAKGRTTQGERQPNAKLTEAAVRAIRERAAAGETHSALATEFGVARQTISDVVGRRRWAFLDTKEA